MKIDMKRTIETYSARRGQFDVVTVPTMQYLMIDGHGDPNTAASYADAVATIYPVAYRMKFFSRNELDRDYTVMPLEALWWSRDMDSFTSARDKSHWEWTVMVLTPEWLTATHVDAAREALQHKGGAPALSSLRLETLDEGLAVQTLHVGPYDDEGPLLDAMHHDFIPSRSLRLAGKHHEVYLSDARRTDPQKLRTILRQPVTNI